MPSQVTFMFSGPLRLEGTSLYLLADCLRAFSVVAVDRAPCVLFEGMVGIPMRLEVGELREGFGGERVIASATSMAEACSASQDRGPGFLLEALSFARRGRHPCSSAPA